MPHSWNSNLEQFHIFHQASSRANSELELKFGPGLCVSTAKERASGRENWFQAGTYDGLKLKTDCVRGRTILTNKIN